MNFYTSVAVRNDEILYRGWENGERVSKRVAYKPSLFVPDAAGDYRTLEGNPVTKWEFAGIREARDFLDMYRDVPNKPTIYGYQKWEYQFIYDEFPNGVEHDFSQIVVAGIDMEVESTGGFPDIDEADREITAITLRQGKEVSSFGYFPYTPKSDRVKYYQCRDEKQLLLAFLDRWERNFPDILTGWNIDFFDVPYLINRIKRVLGIEHAKRLSPWKILRERKIEYQGSEHTVFNPVGLAVLDYLRLYKNKKLVLEPREEYSLGFIAEVELKEKKLDYSEYGTLDELYRNNFERFMDYNIHDERLVEMLEDKLRLIELVCTMAYGARVNYEDVLGSVLQWEVIVHGYLMSKKVVMPPRTLRAKEQLIGAYVKEPDKGLYEWVVSLDLNSLYSHLIMQFNVSPETYRGKLELGEDAGIERTIQNVLKGSLRDCNVWLKEKDYAVAANLSLYDRGVKGFFPALLKEMYDDRVQYKNKMLELKRLKEAAKDKAEKDRLDKEIARYHNAQMMLKVNLNSAYGCLTNEYFVFYSHPNAEAITSSGQVAIQWVEDRVNSYMNGVLGTEGKDYIIASDTDSLYINCGPLVQTVYRGRPKPSRERVVDFLHDMVVQRLEGKIEDYFQELADYTNAAEQKMKMKLDLIADRGVWVGKKMYVLDVLEKEGVRLAEPEIEVKGLASRRSSTPKICREKLKDAFKIFAHGNEPDMHKFIADFRKEFNALPFWEVASPRGIKGMKKYADPRGLVRPHCPIQVRGAIVYNRFLERNGIKDMRKIYDGDKAKFAYLDMPNPFHQNVVAVPDEMAARRLDLDTLVDRASQFEVGFLDPLKKVLDQVGWTTEEVNTVDSLYA